MEHKLSQTQEKLLEQNIVDIDGSTDDDLAIYVREALQRLRGKGSPNISVHITSPGGNVNIGRHIYDMLRLYSGEKTGIVFCFANSMGAIVLQACETRHCAENSFILIHNITKNSGKISIDIVNDEKKMKKVRDDMNAMQNSLYKILSNRTGKTLAQVRKACSKDTHMTAKEALEFGLIDEII